MLEGPALLSIGGKSLVSLYDSVISLALSLLSSGVTKKTSCFKASSLSIFTIASYLLLCQA